MMQVNAALRDQLEESHQMNDALTSDLQKLTNDWEQLREEMLIKEDEWKEEEQVLYTVLLALTCKSCFC
jgi:rootletin